MSKLRLIYENGEAKWIPHDKKEIKPRDGLKEDLTVDGYIKKYGSIEFKGKQYDTKQSYMNAIKSAGYVIKDW